ncbi:hypothetical protein EsDP_00006413 [Epichloe bromicola]|uniref:Uncharacterized protein n=1 Tax=Epichloe bromicola TaxID=79588 RepID=A0ABQ0CXK1_9HYPO
MMNGRDTNGRFAEATQGYAVLADVDANTMVIFAEFLYKGDYDLPHPIEPDCEVIAASPNSKSKSSKRQRLLSRGLQRKWKQPVDKYWITFTEDVAYGYIPNSPAAPILNEKMGIDYSDFFISHAKVFIFADCYGVEDLMNLSMRKLHQALCGFRPSPERISDILALVRFCYDNPAPEKLKEILASYLACYTESVFLVSGFKELLRKKGDFAADLACAMASRLPRTSLKDCRKSQSVCTLHIFFDDPFSRRQYQARAM